MPSISVSHPPATWWRRCPPPPSTATQPASTPPRHESSFSTLVYSFFSPDFRHVSVKVFSAIIVSFYLFFFATVCLRYPLIRATFDEAFFLAFLGVFFFLFFFYLIISDLLYPPLLDPKTRALHHLDPTVIRSFPTVLYSAVKGHKIGEASLACAVCLSDFEDHDTLRLIPRCHHAFHPDCIGKWLASRSTCPVCRANLTSQPAGDWASQLSTELLRVDVKVEAAPPNGGAPERSPQEGERVEVMYQFSC
ncbi:uncharacterized protein J3R85_003481 [Psidium guajava]|nr:uncharacterized protein J3R85_003481 [Psidium guajava]